MDNNTPLTPHEPSPAPKDDLPPSAPGTIPTQTPPSPPEQHTSRFGLLFGILVVLGIVFLGGTYYVVSTQPSSSTTPIVNKEVETQTEIHKLDEQLQSLEQQNIESDFTEVDQELENL